MQLDFLGPKSSPPGFEFIKEFISQNEEQDLLSQIKKLDFETFEMHGVEAKRKIVHYGLSYNFLSRSTSSALPIPVWLTDLTERVSVKLNEKVVEVLVTYYPVGAGIGWHHDAPAFKSLLGISLLGKCRLQLRRGEIRNWEKFEVELAARDAYIIKDEARWKWQHHIPPVKEDRYSLTFRSLITEEHR